MPTVGTVIRAPAAAGQCPACASFLDSPRVDPATGAVGRKCASCLTWVRDRMTVPRRRRSG